MPCMELGPKDIEAIARQVVSLLKAEGGFDAGQPRYVDAATLARELGVERDWVYSHADELGALRLGGPRGRLRFDRFEIGEALAAERVARSALGRPHSAGRHRSRTRPRGKVKSTQISDGPALARRPGRLSNTKREEAPMMKPERQDSPSSERRA